jgi:hypothetical protein
VDLEQLLVFHRCRPESPVTSAPWPRPGLPRPTFRLRTCQREIDILFGHPGDVDSDAEAILGIDAYRFLLEFATGLRSAIPGETNVFGQLRAAWRDYLRATEPVAVRDFAALMEALFIDTRAIRTAFLQDIGGHSYGTLTRKLLRPAPDARILVVGNGALAGSVMPMLSNFELGLINRTLPADPPSFVRRVFALDDAVAAVDWADHVVLCVPRAAEVDASWVGLLAARPAVRAVHLGCRRSDPGPWAVLKGLATLDDLFDLRSLQQDRRVRQLELARAACRARALQRVAELHDHAISAACT